MFLSSSLSSHYEKFLATGEVKCIDEEIPFEIPDGWEWCRLKHICSMQAGKNISASKIFSDKSASHPYRCVGGNGLRGYTENFNTNGHYSIVGRQGALCGCVNIEKGTFYATEHAVVVDTYEILSPLLMYYFLMALNLNRYATATAQPGLAVSNVLEVMCPLPPLKEGERIIEKLVHLMPLIEDYNAFQEKQNILNHSIKEQLKKSILQEAIQGKLVPQDPSDEPASELLKRIREEKQKLVKEGKLKKKDITDSVIFRGDDNRHYEKRDGQIIDISDDIPFEIPDSWQWVRLRNICSIMTGATFKKEDTRHDNQGIRVLRGGNILPFEIKSKDDDIFLNTDCIKQNILLKQNDLITPAVTSLENICKMARVKKDMPTTTVGGFVFILRPYYDSDSISIYLLEALSSPALIEFVKSITNKSGQAFYNIGKERLGSALIPLPPIKEQQRINDIIKMLWKNLR